MKHNTKDYIDCSYKHKRDIPKSNTIYPNVQSISVIEYKNQCKPFDIVFLEGYHLKSRVVQYLTNSPFSHIGIFLSQDIDTSFTEVIPNKGFQIGSIRKYNNYKGNIFIGRVNSQKNSSQAIANKIIKKHKNTPYENFLAYKVLEKFIRRKTTKYSKDRLICSEYVQDIFDLQGWDYKSRKGDFVYPSDIEKSEAVQIIYKLDL